MHASADPVIGRDLHFPGPAAGNEVFEYDVYHMFLIDTHVAVGQEIILERPQLDDFFIGNVVNPDRGEVGKAGKRTHCGELIGLDVNLLFTSRIIVRECIEDGGINCFDALNIVPFVEGLKLSVRM